LAPKTKTSKPFRVFMISSINLDNPKSLNHDKQYSHNNIIVFVKRWGY